MQDLADAICKLCDDSISVRTIYTILQREFPTLTEKQYLAALKDLVKNKSIVVAASKTTPDVGEAMVIRTHDVCHYFGLGDSVELTLIDTMQSFKEWAREMYSALPSSYVAWRDRHWQNKRQM